MTSSSSLQYNRSAIYQLQDLGWTYRDIALRLKCSKSTIGYELNRINKYNPVKAQEDTDNKLHHRGRHYSLSMIKKEIIKDELKPTWSPKEIAHKAYCCVKSIYN